MKTRNIILIVVIVLIVLLLLRFLFRWFWGPMFRGIDYTPEFPEDNLPEDLPDDIPSQQTSTREFEKSDKLTTISFTRTTSVYDGDSDEHKSTEIELHLVLTGYLREVPTSLSNEPVDYLRDYVFDDGSIEWDIYAKDVDADPECVYTYTISEQGSDSPSDLGDTSVHESYRTAKIVYSGSEDYQEDAQLAVKGSFMLSLDELNEVEVYDPSPNVHAICDGHEDSTTFNEIRTAKFEMPLILTNVDINQKTFTGSFSFDEDSGEETLIDAELGGSLFTIFELPYTITEVEPELWDVEWEINLP